MLAPAAHRFGEISRLAGMQFQRPQFDSFFRRRLFLRARTLHQPERARGFDSSVLGRHQDRAVDAAGRVSTVRRSRYIKSPGLRHQQDSQHRALRALQCHDRALAGFALRGAIWYQGESNHGDTNYDLKMSALIGGWRQVWNEGAFPFYFVQITPHKYTTNLTSYSADNDPLPRFWIQQAHAARQIKNTGMAVTTDLVDNLSDIHPRDKRPASATASRCSPCMKLTGATWSAPAPCFEAEAIRPQGRGEIRAHRRWPRQPGSPTVDVVEVAGADGKFVPAEAKIVGKSVEVSAASVANRGRAFRVEPARAAESHQRRRPAR